VFFKLNFQYMKYIFTEKLCSMNFTVMSKQAFSCFKKYFQFVNTNESKLRSEDTVLDFDLVGLERYFST
jgi:regulator of RNase E activity RraB